MEGQERFWQTDKFRTYSSIGLICVLLGTFGVVCFLKYRERLAKGETVAGQESSEKAKGEQGDGDEIQGLMSEGSSKEGTEAAENNAEENMETAEKPEPEGIADLSDDTEPTPIAPPRAAPSEQPEEGVADLFPEADPPGQASAGKVVASPISKDQVSPDQLSADRDSPNRISQEDDEDPFGNQDPSPAAAREASPPAVASNPAGLTKLEEIETEEPATLGKLETEEPMTPVASKAQPPAPLGDEEESPKSSPTSVGTATPRVIQEPEEDALDPPNSRFREVTIGSRQSSGTTKVVASEGKRVSAPPVPQDDEFSSDESFSTPEKSATAVRGSTEFPQESSTETPAFDEEPAPSLTREGPTGQGGIVEGEVYVVRPRDTYWKISKNHFGSVRYFLALAKYNHDQVPNPRLMRPGTRIRIPSAETLEAQFPELFPKQKGSRAANENAGPEFFMEGGTPKYRVGPKDNLTAISGRYLGDESRWNEIYQLNQELLRDANLLPVGTVLLLPSEATAQPMAREPREIR